MKSINTLFVVFFSVLCWAAACSSEQASRTSASAETSRAKLTPDGMAVFRQYCITCHGSDGKLGLNGAKDLTVSPLTNEERINIITNGRKMMTPFKEVLSPEEILAVADYTLSLKK